jgi:hypothetical protein
MTRGGSGTGYGHVAQAELLKLQKSGQFLDEPARIKSHEFKWSPKIVVVYYESMKRKLI